MIVLLSSAFRPRYADDIIRILALPRGGQLQLRYETPLLSEKLLGQIPREQLAGAPALLCFVSDDREIVPLRFARIIRAERLGSTVIFTVSAEAFASDLDDSAIRSASCEEDRPRLPVLPASRKDELFVFNAMAEWRSHETTSLNAFEQIAKRLQKDAAFSSSRTAFFHVVRLSRAKGRSWFGTWPRPEKIREGTYTLATDKRYQCEIYCLHLHEPNPALIGPPAPQLAMAAEPNDDWIQFGSVRRHAIDGRYDVKRFVFGAESNALRRVGGVNLFLTDGLDPQRADYRQDIMLPLIFRGSPTRYLVRALAVGVSTAVPSLIAINAAGKLDNVGIVMLVVLFGVIGGAAAVFPGFKPRS